MKKANKMKTLCKEWRYLYQSSKPNNLKIRNMETKFYQLDGEQKLEAISQMAKIILENYLWLPADENVIALEIEQGYDPQQDFYFSVENGEVKVELREFA